MVSINGKVIASYTLSRLQEKLTYTFQYSVHGSRSFHSSSDLVTAIREQIIISKRSLRATMHPVAVSQAIHV